MSQATLYPMPCRRSCLAPGGGTDTVAAIAGGLLGAAYGASAVPSDWRRVLHGWPGMRTRDVVITRKGEPDGFDFSYSGYETDLAKHVIREASGQLRDAIPGADVWRWQRQSLSELAIQQESSPDETEQS